jgi:hypothetical protein
VLCISPGRFPQQGSPRWHMSKFGCPAAPTSRHSSDPPTLTKRLLLWVLVQTRATKVDRNRRMPDSRFPIISSTSPQCSATSSVSWLSRSTGQLDPVSSSAPFAPPLRPARVAKRLTDSPLLAVFGADLPTNTDPIGRVRKAQDLRQTVFDSCSAGRERKPDIANSQVNECFAEGVGLEPTSPFGQRFSSYERCVLTLTA